MCAAGGPREHAIQRHRAEHSAARGGGSAWARVDLVASRRQGPRPRHVPHYVETKETQPSASWRPGGLLQRQMTPRAAPGSGPPRAIRRLGGAWSALLRPSRACFQRRFHCVLPVREIISAPLPPTASWARKPATAVDERGAAAPSAPSEAALMKAELARLQPYVPEPATVCVEPAITCMRGCNRTCISGRAGTAAAARILALVLALSLALHLASPAPTAATLLRGSRRRPCDAPCTCTMDMHMHTGRVNPTSYPTHAYPTPFSTHALHSTCHMRTCHMHCTR